MSDTTATTDHAENRDAEPSSLSDVMRDAWLALERAHAARAEALGITPGELERRDEDERKIADGRRLMHAARRARDAAIAALAGTNLPPEDRAAIVDGALSKRTKATVAVERWLASPPDRPILVLLGGVGAGKTTAAALALHRSPGAEYVRAIELARRWEPWRHERESGVVPIERDAPLLILDDLGTEQTQDRLAEALYDVIDCRIARGRTLITANLGRTDVRARYGPRVADRLNHAAHVIELGGASLRRQDGGL